MTKEQEKAIYRLNLGKNIPISSECCIVNVKDIEKVLSMLEEKDKEIQFQEDINKTELNRHKKTEKSLKGQIIKQNKIIDLMAEYISNITDCPFESEGKYLDCEKMCDVRTDKECWKQYFENKAKE